MQEPPPDNTQNSQETGIHSAPVGIRTHNPNKRATIDPRFRARGTGFGCLVHYVLYMYNYMLSHKVNASMTDLHST